ARSPHTRRPNPTLPAIPAGAAPRGVYCAAAGEASDRLPPAARLPPVLLVLRVVLLAVDLPADAVLLPVDAPALRRRERAAVRGAVALDLAVDARFLALQLGCLARGDLPALDALANPLLLPPLAPIHLGRAGSQGDPQERRHHRHRRSFHRPLSSFANARVPRETWRGTLVNHAKTKGPAPQGTGPTENYRKLPKGRLRFHRDGQSHAPLGVGAEPHLAVRQRLCLTRLHLGNRSGQPAQGVEDLRLLLHLGALDLGGARGGRRTRLLQRLAGEDRLHVGPVQRLPLEQGLGDPVQRGLVLRQEVLRPLVLGGHDLPDFVVDVDGGLLGEVPRPVPELAAEEHLLLVLAQSQRPELLAHAPLAHHAARELGGGFVVALRAAGDLVDL